MSTLLARFIGLAESRPISIEGATVIVERRSELSYTEAHVVVLDYAGYSRDALSTKLGVSVETIRTYWKRINRKTKCHSREAVRAWFEALLERELQGDAAA
jgi:DNA-binding CsgD family transcriptional regulator